MPTVQETLFFNGAEQRIVRLGLQPLWDELETVLRGFELRIEERRDTNSAAEVRALFDKEFQKLDGWTKKQTGGVDWTKCRTVNGTTVCLGIEIQISGRSDLLIVDVAHLRDELTAGNIDVGIIVVPSDALAIFLTDRVARFTDAKIAVERARATDLPIAILAIGHDGPGPAIPKRRTRQGRLRDPES
ncbi:MAG TPA: hypothetical protein VEW48_03645 [Thermoanaerobaculia bacterium]|nr:hypothetical protein [Thermoanaerobaculia bacterium]